jgi:RES domain-containing protein
MPRIWRLTQSAKSEELNGEENRDKGGRWNSPGRGVVYCSSSLALAAMECWVHMDEDAREHPNAMSAVLLDYPDDAPVFTVPREDLPDDLSDPCCEDLCRTIGDAWRKRGDSLVLIAPSFVVPHEVNFMLNPEHPSMRDVTIVSVEEFQFDPRMMEPEKAQA